MHMRYSDLFEIGPRRFSNSRNRRRKSGSVLVTFTLAFPFLLVPLVGLAIDGTMLYSVKAKLQTAVDGASIAAALNLSSGINFAVQEPAAELTAKQFIAANIGITPAQTTGYWGSNTLNDSDCDANGTPSKVHTQNCVIAAQDDTNKRRTVTVAASVNVPLLFMRVLGFSSATVAAKGQAARRDVVLVLVIDRSSSMVDMIGNVRDGATYFVNQFQAGRDRLGLVAFGGSAIIAYPSTDWPKDVSLAATVLNGPDVNFKNTPDSAAVPNMLTSISNIADASNTGTAEALMLAYKELVAANQPGALNVIVLFTDGKPNGLTANYNNAAFNTNAPLVIKAGSTCTAANKKNGGPNYNSDIAASMIGWIAQGGGYASYGAPLYPPANGAPANLGGGGVNTLMQTNNTTQTSVTNWLKNGSTEPTLTNAPSANCYFRTNNSYVSEDMILPPMDIYGNSTTGVNQGKYTTNDYKQSEIWGGECNNGNRAAAQDLTKSNDPCQVGLASWNAADMAAKQIIADPTGLKPVIYSMGYQGNGGIDQVLLERLSNINVAENTVYDATKPQGLFLPIATVNDIAPAFQRVLAEILRLSM